MSEMLSFKVDLVRLLDTLSSILIGELHLVKWHHLRRQKLMLVSMDLATCSLHFPNTKKKKMKLVNQTFKEMINLNIPVLI